MKSPKERGQLVAPVYRRWGTPGVCTYCGCLGDSWDHVPPLSMVPPDPERWEGRRFWLISACRLCNSMLANVPLLLVGSRKAYLVRQYKRKYRSELAIPEWSDEEMKRMGKNMRSKIEAGLKAKSVVQAMLGVLERECIEPHSEDEP